ncbi:MAG: hypothetical protein E6R03_01430 [Hyphomicrobiaceae bacterium]|nr:MAG: hypothetical protein E6R03_01430 [Hyphomicrobiaceae bacterium]
MLKFHDKVTLVGTIDPASVSVGSVNTDVIDMSKFHKALFVLTTGVLGASATVDFGIYGDTASGGSFATPVTGKAITQIVKASGDNVQTFVEVNGNDLRLQGFTHIRGKLTVGTAASIAAVTVLATEFNYGTADDNKLSTLGQIVA